MTTLQLTDDEWARLVALRNITACGQSLNAAETQMCDELAARIKVPRPPQDKVLTPGTPPTTTPIVNQPPDSMVVV